MPHVLRVRCPPQVGREFYRKMVVDSEYQGEDYDEFSNWLATTQ